MLKIRDLSRKYNSKKCVLDHLNWNLLPGQFHVLIGRNGSGKSTLMKIISGQDPFESGTAEWNGLQLGEWGIGPRAEIALVSEVLSVPLTMKMTDLVLAHQEICGSGDVKNWIAAIETHVGFELNRQCRGYSRGQIVRILLELAFLRRPKLILLDEVTSVLDVHARKIAFQRLSEFRKTGGTILLATNIISEVTQIADTYHILDKGKILLSGSLSELTRSFIKYRVPSGTSLNIIGAVEVDLNEDGSIGYLTSSAANPPSETGFQIEQPTLSDVFVYLTHLRS